MARLTDSGGQLLGGLDTSPARFFTPPVETDTTPLWAPTAPPLTPEYEAGEVVFALKCSYGTLSYLTFAPATERRDRGDRPYECQTLVEEPDERHHCPACGGFYCATHATPAAHDCRSVLRPE